MAVATDPEGEPRPAGPTRLDERIEKLYRDAEACAAAAGLVYVSDDEAGIHRRRQGRGFGYRDADGQTVGATVKARIVALAIPPAWTNVWICPDERGHLLAVGEDARGRKQYIYHERWRVLRDLLNFYRLITFGRQLPVVRAYTQQQMRRRTLDRDRVLACMIRVMDLSAVRVGNEVYADENDSFGLTTLGRRHVTVSGGEVRLRFPAKSGKRADLVIADRRVARVMSELQRARSRRLFTLDRRPVDSAEINALLEHLTGEHVTSKDFRTWHATHVAFRYLEEHVGVESDRERVVLEAVDLSAALLGNSRTVARAHYVHPHVLSTFLSGSFQACLRARRAPREQLLADSECRLLAFLDAALEFEFDAAGLGLD